ncbi:hypothetical protein FHY17_000202 [Xanthomonas arboricola]|uniref:HTH domain-containing protein n=1 Tax=Xanthomonas arboricola TaxID=56448 RepID=UPI001607B5EC|nr:hypothetical protein [Xanthomonas arboricola]MBB3796006.1 hypothetical protein [Xanthomonas arboricola]
MSAGEPLMGIASTDAAATQGGFQYQNYASALAWLRLEPDGMLYIETAEDYATQDAAGAVVVQVRRVQQALTLRGVLPFLGNVVRHIENHPALQLQFVYLTTATVGTENPRLISGGRSGIDAWNAVKRGEDPTELIGVLKDLADEGGALAGFLAKHDTATVFAKLITAISWLHSAADIEDLRYQAQEAFAARVHAETGAGAIEARKAFPQLVDRITSVSASKEASARVLTHKDLTQLIQNAVGRFLLHDEHQKLKFAAEIAQSIEPSYFDSKIIERTTRLRKGRFFISEEELVRDGLALFQDTRRGGNLQGGTPPVRALALNWCARVLLDRAPEEADAAFLEARSLNKDELGHVVAALQAARTDPEAGIALLHEHRSVLAMTVRYFLKRKVSTEAALDWVKAIDMQPEALDEDGRFFVLNDLLSVGRWEQIERWIARLPPLTGECPALNWSVGFGLTGLSATPSTRGEVLHAVPLFGQVMLRDTGGAQAKRSRAAHEFRSFSAWASENGLTDRANNALKYAIWLDLQDPARKQSVRAEIESRREAEPDSFEWIAIAAYARVNLDAPTLITSLERRIRIYGGLQSVEAESLLALLISSDPAEWLDRWALFNEELRRHFSETGLANFAIQAFMARERVEDARVWLRENLVGDPEARQQLLAWIETRTGGNEVAQLQQRMEDAPSEAARRELLDALMRTAQWARALPLARTVFDDSQSHHDAETLAHALDAEGQWAQIVELLADPQLVGTSRLLQGHLVTALFNLGRWEEALSAARSLEMSPERLDEVEQRVALYSGHWDRLGIQLERAAVAGNLSPDALLQWAHIAKVLDKPRLSKKLTHQALALPNADPQRWMQGYSLAVSGNWESDPEVTGWLHLAIQSASDDGPVQRRSLKELVAAAPEWKEKTQQIAAGISSGSMFQAIAAKQLNRGLSSLYCATSEHNRRERDPGQRAAIAAYAAIARESGPLSEVSHIALDTTALLTLAELELLDAVLRVFDSVALPHALGAWIFKERERTPYHQPSKVADAKKLVSSFSRSHIKVLTRPAEYSRALAAEVGEEIPRLIASAEASGLLAGQWLIVETAPVYQPNSLGEEEADVGPCAQHLRSLHCVVESLQKYGAIPAKSYERAKACLANVDRGWGEEPTIPRGTALLITDLALNYLEHLELIDACMHSDFALWVDRSVREEAHAYEAVEDVSQTVLSRLDRVRQLLMLSGNNPKITVLPRPPAPRVDGDGDANEQAKLEAMANDDGGSVMLLHDLFTDLSSVEALVIDDRAANRYPKMTDGRGEDVVVVSTLDVLDALKDRGEISFHDWMAARTELRRAGYVFIPFVKEELIALAQECAIENGELRESLQARAFRENHQLAQFSRLFQQPQETPWLAHNNRAVREAVVTLWTDAEDPALVSIQCAWLVELSRLDGFGPSLPSPLNADRWNYIEAMLLWSLVIPMTLPEERQERYAHWLEEEYLDEMAKQRPISFGIVVDMVKQQLASISDFINKNEIKIPAKQRQLLALKLAGDAVNALPPSVQEAVIADVALLKRFGMERKRSISLHLKDDPVIDAVLLYEAAARCANDGDAQSIEDSLGGTWALTRDDVGEVWGRRADGHVFQVRHAQLLLRNEEQRNAYIRSVYEAHGLFGDKIPFERLSSASIDAIDAFEEDLEQTARGFSERLHQQLASGSVQGSALVPRDRRYFERLVGPRGESQTVQQFAGTKRENRVERDGIDGLADDLLVSAHSMLVPVGLIKSAPAAELRSWIAERIDGLDLWSLTGLIEGLLARDDLLVEFESEAMQGISLLTEHADGASERLGLQAALIAHIDGSINTGQMLLGEPPFWRRAASIAQAAVVERVLLSAGVPLSSFSVWAKQAWPRFQAATLCDLVKEPRWHGYLLQPGQLSQELIGRVMNAASLRRGEIDGSQLGELIFAEAKGSLASKWSVAFAGLPGPLEGGTDFAPALPELLIEETMKALDQFETPLHERLLIAAHTTGLGRAPELLIDKIAATLRSFDASLADVEEVLVHKFVIVLAMAASDSRHSGLAKAIEEFVVARPNLPIAVRLHAGLTACGAFENESEWIDAVVLLVRRLTARGLDREEASHIYFVMSTMCEVQWSLRAPLGDTLARLQSSMRRL